MPSPVSRRGGDAASDRLALSFLTEQRTLRLSPPAPALVVAPAEPVPPRLTPRRRRGLAQAATVAVLCGLGTGATVAVVGIGSAEVDETSVLVTAPYTPGPSRGPMLVPAPPAGPSQPSARQAPRNDREATPSRPRPSGDGIVPGPARPGEAPAPDLPGIPPGAVPGRPAGPRPDGPDGPGGPAGLGVSPPSRGPDPTPSAVPPAKRPTARPPAARPSVERPPAHPAKPSRPAPDARPTAPGPTPPDAGTPSPGASVKPSERSVLSDLLGP